MYGELNSADIDAVLGRRRYGRLGFTLDGEVYVIPINYAYDGQRLYGQAPIGSPGGLPGGTKVRGMRQNPNVAFEVDEIQDPAHWRSVLVQGRFHELHDPAERRQAFERIGAQAGGGERSEVSWALGLEHLVVFAIEITQRHGRFEAREAVGMRPGRQGPLPPATPGAAKPEARRET
jgi:nitroimidazol reductase NimA-like FMN-containing flavoprotein (pyridoxamine 5'-phosphate oxidase superfamily)